MGVWTSLFSLTRTALKFVMLHVSYSSLAFQLTVYKIKRLNGDKNLNIKDRNETLISA